MAGSSRQTAMKIAYGALFVVALPLALWAWARAASDSVRFHGVRSPLGGTALIAAGAALVLWSWAVLATRGGGLPMNPFPPSRHVTSGPYRWLSHPIYVGFCAVVLGAGLVTGSASGQWLVFPTTVLGCIALVYGVEQPALLRRFGELHRPVLALPPATDERVTPADRLSTYALVLIPWLGIYEAITSLGIPPDAHGTLLESERHWPVLPWTEVVYASLYLGVAITPWLCRRRRHLRRFCVDGLLAMAVVFPLYLALPLVSPPRPLTSNDGLSHLLLLERQLDTAACSFPSFHVIWALIAGSALASRSRVIYVWSVAVIVSCVTTGMHSVLDVGGGIAAFGLVRRAPQIWELVRRSAEAVANSWRDWRVGSVRFISHGLWAGIGTLLGLIAIAAVLGPGSGALVIALWLGGLLGAGVWAQVIEGASGLSRPFGFYGGLLGMTLVGLFAPAFGYDRMVALAACCVGAPFVQSFGRMRCLVQGCCHGLLCSPAIGIRYRHPLSRVHKVPELFEQPLHPTPVYSVLWNGVIAIAMLRLATLHAPAHLVGGIYLILGGAGRFVEEALRGEPQTPILAGLRLYQWVALVSFVGGAALTGWGNGPSIALQWPDAHAWTISVACSIANTVALGLDFPASNRRLSRLA